MTNLCSGILHMCMACLIALNGPTNGLPLITRGRLQFVYGIIFTCVVRALALNGSTNGLPLIMLGKVSSREH